MVVPELRFDGGVEKALLLERVLVDADADAEAAELDCHDSVRWWRE